MNYRISDPKIAELIKNKKKVSSADSENIKKDKNELEKKQIRSKNIEKNKNEKDFYKKFKAKETKKKRKKLKKPSTKNLALATKQLSSMVKTGLPLLESLSILSDSTEDKTIIS